MQENTHHNHNTSFHISVRVFHLGLLLPSWFVSPNLAGTAQLVKLHTEVIWTRKCWYWIAVLAAIQFSLITQRLHARSVIFLCKWCKCKYCMYKDVLILKYKTSTEVWQKHSFCYEGETLILLRDTEKSHSWGLWAEVCACLQLNARDLER